MGIPFDTHADQSIAPSIMDNVNFDIEERYHPDTIFYPLIRAFLESPTTTLESAVQQIFGHVAIEQRSLTGVWELTVQLVQIAHCCPPDHPTAHRLLDLIAVLRESPQWPTEGAETGDSCLKMSLTEQFDGEITALTWQDDDEDQSQTHREDIIQDFYFRNFQAFGIRLSRVLFGAPAETKVLPWCLYMMEAGNEGGHARFMSPRMRDAYPLAAAWWIKEYGSTLYACVINKAENLRLFQGPLWKEQAKVLQVPISESASHRWNFWNKQFRALASGRRDHEIRFATATKDAAAEAASLMDEIEAESNL